MGKIFGPETVVTGFLIIIFMIPIYSATNPKIKTLNPKLFKYTHLCWVPVIILCFIHGKGCWNTNFWKFMIGPVLIYIFDLLYVRGLDNMADFLQRGGVQGQS